MTSNKAAIWHLNRYYARLAKAIEYLGGVCIECSTTEQLEFDHVDPTEKEFTVTEIMLHADGKLYTELDKCVLRCKPHHLERTRRQKGVPHGGGLSGKGRCSCELCRAKKAEYNQNYRQICRERKQAEVGKTGKPPYSKCGV